MLWTADLATSVLQGLYESEINYTVSAFWDCGFRWSLGDPLNGFLADGAAQTFEQAVSDLAQAAVQHFPNSAFARSTERRPWRPPL
jgi:hypothetical protein